MPWLMDQQCVMFYRFSWFFFLVKLPSTQTHAHTKNPCERLVSTSLNRRNAPGLSEMTQASSFSLIKADRKTISFIRNRTLQDRQVMNSQMNPETSGKAEEILEKLAEESKREAAEQYEAKHGDRNRQYLKRLRPGSSEIKKAKKKENAYLSRFKNRIYQRKLSDQLAMSEDALICCKRSLAEKEREQLALQDAIREMREMPLCKTSDEDLKAAEDETRLQDRKEPQGVFVQPKIVPEKPPVAFSSPQREQTTPQDDTKENFSVRSDSTMDNSRMDQVGPGTFLDGFPFPQPPATEDTFASFYTFWNDSPDEMDQSEILQSELESSFIHHDSLTDPSDIPPFPIMNDSIVLTFTSCPSWKKTDFCPSNYLFPCWQDNTTIIPARYDTEA